MHEDMLVKYRTLQKSINEQHRLPKGQRMPKRKVDQMIRRSNTLKRWLKEAGKL
ncbi:MAG TPA: hypothetical protein VMW32_12320 [Bacteroidales bacterium]|nr:hypothetical protein [Bacteroidales bacterium]